MKQTLALLLLSPISVGLPQSAPAQTPLRTTLVAEDIPLPVFVTHAPNDHHRIFVLTKAGKIYVIKHGLRLPTPFLDVDPIASSVSEQGLLGLAFHPGFPIVNEFFINYTDNNGDTVIARHSVSDNPDVANPVGEIVLTQEQPQANHNGGWLGFGPDGYLYIALGDGGGQRDPSNLGQNIVGELLGSILRIDVDSDDFPKNDLRNYAIPPDNPLVGAIGEDEIWAYGLRNPWRCAFDSLTGDFYIADVGQQSLEEINFQPAASPGGQNYGWRCFEGTECTLFGGCNCPALSTVQPVFEYAHLDMNCSVSGGEVYRGCAIPDLAATYFFADYCSALTWSLRFEAGHPVVLERTGELNPAGKILSVSSFGSDAAGEIYLCEYFAGKIWKIMPDPGLEIAASHPPDTAIDARVDLAPDLVTPLGWDRVAFEFTSPAGCLTQDDFLVSAEAAAAPDPTVMAIESDPGGLQAAIVLSDPIEAGSWLRVFQPETWTAVRFGSLPGDVDASRMTTPLDALALIDGINGAAAPRPIWSVDIDRSQALDTADAAALIGLLDGSLTGTPWYAQSLP